MTSEPLAAPVSPDLIVEEPLWLGPRLMPSRYFLAPLAGYTHLALRLTLRELGGLGLATTDLVLATHLLSRNRHSLELIETSSEDRPLSIQIFGGQIRDLVAAARWLEDHGYEAVDLNMGCPMAKVNGQGGGARLMCDTDNACRLVESVVSALSIPVSVKMRLGWDRDNLTAPYLAARFEQAGVVAITIHGRTRQQGFSGDVNLDGIAATVAAVSQIPIIGNGDVRTVAEAHQMRRYTGCAAIAIGRGALLDPWLFRKLADADAGLEPREPSPNEQVDFLVRHFTRMTEQHGERSCILFRKFAAWYGAKLGIPEDLEQRLRLIESIDTFHNLAAEIRERHGERQSGIATALVKVPNGPVERW
jgi:tRNA-dihydrouridine synthase B